MFGITTSFKRPRCRSSYEVLQLRLVGLCLRRSSLQLPPYAPEGKHHQTTLCWKYSQSLVGRIPQQDDWNGATIFTWYSNVLRLAQSATHGDQNAFTLHAFGETLASITGYYGGFGVDMHTKWRRQTFSKTCHHYLAVRSNMRTRTQVTKTTKIVSVLKRAVQSPLNFDTESDVEMVEVTQRHSISTFVPEIESYKRKIWFVQGKVFAMQDKATLSGRERHDLANAHNFRKRSGW